MPEITKGTVAPNFELPDQNGRIVRLSRFRGQRPVVLYFYQRRHERLHREACKFRDESAGIRSGRRRNHRHHDNWSNLHARFAAKYKLLVTLLSDKGGGVRKLYGVKKTLGIIPGRVTFVIDKEGVVRHVFSSQMNARQHVMEALEALKNVV